MLRPSYSELMDILNNDSELDSKITSRYAIVIAASKRARQLIDGAEQICAAPTDKAVSIAVNEIYTGHIRIVPEAPEFEHVETVHEIYAEEALIDFNIDDDDSESDDDKLGDSLDIDFDDEEFDDEIFDDDELDDYDEDDDEDDTSEDEE